MDALRAHGHPILILGAGRGGAAMLEMFMEEPLATVVGIADKNPQAPGLALARKHGIKTFTKHKDALHACAPCLVFNLTHDDSIPEQAAEILGTSSIIGGIEAKLIWQMVTGLKNTSDKLKENQRQLQAIIHSAMDGIITIRENGEIMSFNPAAEKIFGYTKEEVLQHSINMLIPEPERSRHNNYISRYLETGKSRIVGAGGREITARHKDGSTFPMGISVSEMILRDQRYFVGIVRDITERKRAEEKIRFMAHYDQLTGLANRNLLYDRLRQALAQSRRYKKKLALLFLDLDGFKPVNDTFGHNIGDLLLKEVAVRLQGCVREVDTAARVGGDEFVVILFGIGDRKHAASSAAKILHSLARPCLLEGKKCRVGGSIGIAMSPDDGEDIDSLLNKADNAMYHAKSTGKNSFSFHEDAGAGR